MSPVLTVLDEFEQLTAAVLDGTATAADRRRFNEIAGEYPEFRSIWLEQVRLHALLVCRSEEHFPIDFHKRKSCRGQFRLRWSRGLWWKAAALFLAAAGVAAVWRWSGGVQHFDLCESVQPERTEVPRLRLVRQAGVTGLELPQALPGKIRVASGTMAIRLPSGVELTLCGPVDMDVFNTMQVFLTRGRLLARVPHWATGFTVRTRELEVCDLGTVFGISVDETFSGVFVFKGRVQINEAGEGGAETAMSGTRVGVFEAGEGVLTAGDGLPMRFVADSEAALKLFGTVKGCAALRNPNQAFQAVRLIADLWVDHYLPGSRLAARSKPNGVQKGTNTIIQTSCSCCSRTAEPSAVAATQAVEMYCSTSDGGYCPWDAVGNWYVYQSSGGGSACRLPASNDTVRINAATLAAENGNALVIGKGVHAACGSFASGFKNYPGTASLRLEGGALTSRTTTVIGMYYPGLAVLESGSLYSGTDFYIGGYGDAGIYNGCGIVTNDGAVIDVLSLHVGHEANTFGRLVHNGGTLQCRPANTNASLQVGFDGGVGEFEANADFSTYAMGIGDHSAESLPPGTGTVTLARGAVGVIHGFLRVGNGTLFMKGGSLRFQNAAETLANLYVRRAADCQTGIRGWGRFVSAAGDLPLRMINNGVIIADGEGVERDLDFDLIAVVNSHIPNTVDATNGWYAVDKGRLLFPRSVSVTFPACSPVTVCCGDLYRKAVPEMVNSVGVTLTYPAQAVCTLRGGICAPDRSDIPFGLPDRLRLIGVWFIGSEDTNKLASAQASYTSAALTFRYDHAQLRATDRLINLYRFNGREWQQVGSGLPSSDSRISTDTPLAPVSSGEYNIGWFAVMATERNGTLLAIF